MNKTFKFSTFVLKLMAFSFILASFGLSTAKAAQVSENEKMVLGTVRLSLWYQGIYSASVPQQDNKVLESGNFGVEELDRALHLHDKRQNRVAFDSKR